VPAGKAIALAAMPTAVLMGMGFTPTLARAEDPTKQSLTADEYKDCVAALEAADEDTDTSASPTPTPSASAPESDDPATDDGAKDEDTSTGDGDSASGGNSADDDSSSSDSGSDDKGDADESTTDPADKSASDATATPSPTPSAEEAGSGNVLEDIGDALEDIFVPEKDTEDTAPEPSTTPSPSASEDTAGDTGSDTGKAGKDAKDAKDDATDKVTDTAKDVTDAAKDAKDDAEGTADDATATPSPTPSPSDKVNADDCPVATEDESGVEKGIPALPNDPWYLNASSLLLKGADYQGIVKVRTADGSVKEVLKYVISDGTDIGDLHQTVDDKQAGVTYHVQARKGSTSTIRDGKTIMYTESISGNLLGLIPVTFDPKHPPPLNIPLIYFTNVKVVQAGQFGGTLTVPGLHQFTTD
jgi:hypothetical protein